MPCTVPRCGEHRKYRRGFREGEKQSVCPENFTLYHAAVDNMTGTLSENQLATEELRDQQNLITCKDMGGAHR